MAVYYTTKCPHCKQLHERRKDSEQPYGSPFKTCKFCGKPFVDTDYVEIGLLENKDIKESSFGWGAPALIVFGIIILAVTWGDADTPALILGLGMIAFGLFNIIYNLRWKPENDEALQKMVKESKRRLSDPHYVIALWKNDCYVTPEIVAWAKREIGSNNPQTEVFEKAKTTDMIV